VSCHPLDGGDLTLDPTEARPRCRIRQSGVETIELGLLPLQSVLLALIPGLQIRYLTVELDHLPDTYSEECDNEDASQSAQPSTLAGGMVGIPVLKRSCVCHGWRVGATAIADRSAAAQGVLHFSARSHFSHD
jgi:hypothetical protein